MRVDVYRLRAWTKDKKIVFELDYEFKDEGYLWMKGYLRDSGYRVEECFAWS